jgi:fatty acid desaturase
MTATGWEIDRNLVLVDDVRDMMPRRFALPLTLLTGKPCHHHRPIRFTSTRHLANAVVSLAADVAVSLAALRWGGWTLALLVIGWAMTLHGMRNLRMLIFHQCAHRNMWRRPRLDTAVGRVIAASRSRARSLQHRVQFATDRRSGSLL